MPFSIRRTSPLRSDIFTLLSHWAAVVCVLISLVTGLGIALDSRVSPAGLVALLTSGVLPSGRLLDWHMVSGLLLTVVMSSYTGYQVRTGAGKRFLVHRGHQPSQGAHTTPETAAGAESRRKRNRRTAIIWGLFLCSGGLLATGLVLLLPNSTLPSALTAWLHGLAAIVLLVIVAIHAVYESATGRLGKMLWARARGWKIGGAATLSALLGLGGAALVAAQPKVLTIEAVASAPKLDGRGDDAAWLQAQQVAVMTTRGANFDDGSTEIRVSAVHDGTWVYFLLTWDDPTESRLHLPLVKTDAGWRLEQTGFADDDENTFYEDKLALLFSETPGLATETVHLGSDFVDGPHRLETRGLHYTDGAVFDLWHWKSLRTGSQQPSRIDDNHIGPPQPSVRPGLRYTGGYQPDWGAAGYHLNFCFRDDPDCRGAIDASRTTGEYRPPPGLEESRFRRCEASGSACEAALVPILVPKATGDGNGVLRPRSDLFYDPDTDDLPVGTRVPGVVIYGRLNDDRGDIQAQARWKNGQWTLEARRTLTTGSSYDVQFKPGSPVYLWLAAFDHSQTRHTRHLFPIKLQLPEPPTDPL